MFLVLQEMRKEKLRHGFGDCVIALISFDFLLSAAALDYPMQYCCCIKRK